MTLPPFFSAADMDIAAFDALCSQTVILDDYPYAAGVEQNIVIYDGDNIREALNDTASEAVLKAELTCCLRDGPGVLAIKRAYADTDVIDRMTLAFNEIIAHEKASGQGRGDHFGSNERIWNSMQKTCLHAPDTFIDYYGNPIMALVCQAWLGPHYQITAQVNNVKPGSRAQSVHRDYHLGFQSQETVAQFPAHAQMMSQYLTLQGAIAHVDMPLEAGPTLLLPFSHQFPAGYMAYTQPEFIAYFDAHKSQIPLNKGDAVFFSPALFHGAGTNQAPYDRMVNLVQVSSAFGRTMETINNIAMIEAVYPILLQRIEEGTVSERDVANTIAAVGDGYSFPTNLDSDPPVGGNAPETGQQLMRRALESKWTVEQLREALVAYAQRREA
ncbi:MAG: phytanoyl-CoA dioxygenase [Chloroflexi bacterium]|nr:MAG: phytanoyl-CoA dioxygenase [Chloroflexota bacterium]